MQFRVMAMGLAISVLTLGVSESTFGATKPDNGIQQDKLMHFGLSAGLHSTCYAVMKGITDSKWVSQVGCFVAVNTAGAIKEYRDPKNGGTRDENDIYANLAGSGMSFLVISAAF